MSGYAKVKDLSTGLGNLILFSITEDSGLSAKGREYIVGVWVSWSSRNVSPYIFDAKDASFFEFWKSEYVVAIPISVFTEMIVRSDKINFYSLFNPALANLTSHFVIERVLPFSIDTLMAVIEKIKYIMALAQESIESLKQSIDAIAEVTTAVIQTGADIISNVSGMIDIGGPDNIPIAM